jgi:hypothetical protein
MQLGSSSRALGLASAWLVVLACGSRTELLPGQVAAAAGSSAAGSSVAGSGTMPVPECQSALDCPQPPPGQCGFASCSDGVCQLDIGPVCDDGDPCTVDSCSNNACRFEDGRVDADGDGAFASGTKSDPKAALGCGKDCDDTLPQIFPGAPELCDALDNDCNGVVDDDAQLMPAGVAPTRVSPPESSRSSSAGLAFDGQAFGASMTSLISGRFQGQFQQIDAQGKLVGQPQRIAHVNAEAYGGPLAWSGDRYVTAYQDARQDGNYEIYFDQLNRKGERVIEDLRVTNADDFSLRPSVLWTGAETLLIWDDRRFEGDGDASALFGQRISADGQLLGGNVRVSPNGVFAESASSALSASGVGVAFISLDSSDRPRLSFLTTSRALDRPSAASPVSFDDPDEPVVTALGDEYVITFHQDTGAFIGPSIYGVVVNEAGVVSAPQSLTAGAAHARGNATFSYGDRFVMVWADDRDGTYQLYAQTFDKKLSPISTRQRLVTTMSNTLDPVVAAGANGSIGVLYTDELGGVSRTFFTRLDCVVSQHGLK